MSSFKNDEDLYTYIGGVFERGIADPDLGPKFEKSGVVLQIHYTDPDAVLTVDMPNGKVIHGATDVQPNVQMFMSADHGNQFWLGKLNLATAMAKGQVRAKGPVPKVLKLVPIAKKLFPVYQEMLTTDGRTDLLNA